MLEYASTIWSLHQCHLTSALEAARSCAARFVYFINTTLAHHHQRPITVDQVVLFAVLLYTSFNTFVTIFVVGNPPYVLPLGLYQQ